MLPSAPMARIAPASSNIARTIAGANTAGPEATAPCTALKAMSVQTVTPEAARRIAEPAAILARLEGLEAHARAADARLEALA